METILLSGAVIITILFLGALHKLFQRIKKYYSATNRELRDLEDRIRAETANNRIKMESSIENGGIKSVLGFFGFGKPDKLSKDQVRNSKEFSKYMDKLIELKSSELQNDYEQEMSSVNNESHKRIKKIEKDADIIINSIEEKLIGKSLKKELDKMS